ncbi:hypothetical protein DSO57_1033355 [Entomophthora muscae]|uniref:Uncharacterized protein n=1 Tax=Entomophthora muscae TaxID=34485 RepID=A0ACC2SD44_9FUNG|nr:hypothetical protein DSO57_1033355 [Entomophthora muscae]
MDRTAIKYIMIHGAIQSIKINMLLSILLFALAAHSQATPSDSVLNYPGDIVPALVQMQPASMKESHSNEEATKLVEHLQEVAKKSQEAIVNFMESQKTNGEKVDYRSYYISNTLAVDASKKIIRKIAKFAGVQSVTLNRL